MGDEVPLLIKLSHPAAAGKSRDSKEVPVGPENRRRKPGRKREGKSGAPVTVEDETRCEETPESRASGKVLDITI